jgi:hypothetical protein
MEGDELTVVAVGVLVAHQPAAQEEVLPLPNRSFSRTIRSTNDDGGG